MRAYLELVRPANVLTAAADVIAGSAAAHSALHVPSPWLVLSTASLYAGGITLNDFFDRDLDARERPERPIPSGRVSAGTAANLGFALLAAGVACAVGVSRAAVLVAAAIAAGVMLYDSWAKHTLAGPFVMASCRALNFLLGLAAVPVSLGHRWPLAVLPFILIFAVTLVSRGEVHGAARQVGAFALGAVGLVTLGSLVVSVHLRPSYSALALTAAFGWVVGPAFWAAWQTPDATTIRRAVKEGVLSLLVLDAVITTAYAGPVLALVVVALAAAARALSRAFAVT